MNLIIAGNNYGWPPVHHRDILEGTTPPIAEYTPASHRPDALFASAVHSPPGEMISDLKI